MDLYAKIIETYPTLTDNDFVNGVIRLQDDGDGIQYIAEWNYSEPIPTGLKLGKPKAK